MTSRIECTECGLCCCKLAPIWITKSDVKREPKLLKYARTIKQLKKKFKKQKVKDSMWKPSLLAGLFSAHTNNLKGFLALIFDYKELPCPMLDKNKLCTIYETRPGICRKFEAGGEDCNKLRKEYGMSKLLPIIKD